MPCRITHLHKPSSLNAAYAPSEALSYCSEHSMLVDPALAQTQNMCLFGFIESVVEDKIAQFAAKLLQSKPE